MPQMKRTSETQGMAMSSRREDSQGSGPFARLAGELEATAKGLRQAAGRFFAGAADAATDV